MDKLIRYYRYINILSLDIVAGAVISALFFARIFEVTILPYGLISLALTVWCIYTADHLRDARNISGVASTFRHRFHQQHFKIVLVIFIVAILLDLLMIFFIRKQVLQGGLLLSALVLVYLLIQKFLRFLKELVIAVLYTCGVTLPSISVSDIGIKVFSLTAIVAFAVIALINLLMFSWFDRDYDRKDQQPSFVQLLGESITRQCIYWLIILCYALLIFAGVTFAQILPFIILALMNTMLLLIFLFRKTLSVNERYRFFGDLVFLLPIIYLL